MRVLFDTDMFCRLGAGELFEEALAVLGSGIADCARLPAVTYMLKRGRLLELYGPEVCSRLLRLAEMVSSIDVPDAMWLDRLIALPSIDPGEAQLFATAASESALVVTGDKRALHSLREVEGYPEALAGRIVTLETIMLVLCDRLGDGEVRRRLGPVARTDITLAICFSPDNQSPRKALESYHRELIRDVEPLRLWDPKTGGVA
jgi:hypothetical protein